MTAFYLNAADGVTENTRIDCGRQRIPVGFIEDEVRLTTT